MSSRVVVALDSADLGRLRELAAALGPHASHLKVGLEAFVAHGARAVEVVREHGRVFLDLKLHDIPHTVRGAAAAANALGVDLLTVHASGGPAMVEAAVEAAPEVRVLAVTVLTSLDDAALASMGVAATVDELAPRLAACAADAGAAGIVCAPTDLAAMRARLGPHALLVTPGVRPAGADAGDQARVATPRAAVRAGADLLVVGRPITQAPDPVAALRAIDVDVEA